LGKREAPGLRGLADWVLAMMTFSILRATSKFGPITYTDTAVI